MPRATKEQSAATAARVLATARELFLARGYDGVGLAEIAAAADVTRGAVYHHFHSKQGLFEAVLAVVQAELADAVRQSATGDRWERLEHGCRAYLGASVGEAVRRILLVDAPAVLGWTTWREHDAAGPARLLQSALTGLADEGALRVSPLAATALLNGAMNEAALWIATAPDPDRALAQAWTGLQLVLRALRADGLSRSGAPGA